MLQTLAVANYRSIRSLVMPLGSLNLITGANGSGKSNLYRALRLLAEAAQGGIVSSLAREGGLSSTLWAGPETISRGMKKGTVPVEGGPRKEVIHLRLGFITESIGYETSLHPDLLPALARLIEKASTRSQVWVVSHASRMIAALKDAKGCNAITLTKELGETAIGGQGLLDAPPWKWPER